MLSLWHLPCLHIILARYKKLTIGRKDRHVWDMSQQKPKAMLRMGLLLEVKVQIAWRCLF